MKKIVVLLLSVLLACGLVGCSSKPETEVAQDATLTIKLGFSTNDQDPRALAAMQFKEEVEKNTEGKITIEIFPSGQLGADAALLEAVALDSGTVDMFVTDASNFATYETTMGISALPFLFEDFESAWSFMDGDLQKSVEDKLIDSNMRVLAHYDNGFRCVTTSKIDVQSPDDMKGMLIRTPENPVIMSTMKALGANPQPLAFSELYMALQQGSYDGQENPIPVIYNNKLNEVQKYLSVTNHIYSGMCLTIAESTWSKLSASQQEIVQNAATNSAKFNRELNKQQTEELLSKLEEAGMVITNPDLAPFQAASQSVYDELKASYGEELMSQVEAYKNK